MSSSEARLPGRSANTGCATPSFNCSRASRREREPAASAASGWPTKVTGIPAAS